MIPSHLMDEATAFYLGSTDFNGYPCHKIRCLHKLSEDELKTLLYELVEQGKGSLVFGDIHPNPYIRAFHDEPKAKQLDKLKSQSLDHVCLYPTSDHLKNVVDVNKYKQEPYTLELALGSGQLEFRVFDLSVLEIYRNDPRYYYMNDEINGKICINDEFYLSSGIPERDKILLGTFGFAYDHDLNRAVAVCLRYLRKMSSEHQQIWKSKELIGSYKLHPGYRNSILGNWSGKISIFAAFVTELNLINNICDFMGKPRLFKEDFYENRPRNFYFLVRPTLEEYNSFIHTLDKMMSDNIDKKFFIGEVSDTSEETRTDGKIIVTHKGTITMLDEWLNISALSDSRLVEDLISMFRKVRTLRQKPAHVIRPNVFDQKFFHLQRELIVAAYKAVRTLRLIFTNHPLVRAAKIDIPDALYEGKIWTY